jgi:hypothetical protein
MLYTITNINDRLYVSNSLGIIFNNEVKRTSRHPHLLTRMNPSHFPTHELDDPEGDLPARGFSDGFHEGVVSLIIQTGNQLSLHTDHSPASSC